MDSVQTQHERAVGDEFIAWYNGQNKRNLIFDSRPLKAPDFIYRDGKLQPDNKKTPP